MTDIWRRLLEQQEAIRRAAEGYADIQRRLDPMADAMKSLGIGAHILHFLGDEETQRKMMADVVGQSSLIAQNKGAIVTALQDAERQRKLLEGPLEEARRLGLLDPSSDLRQAMSAAIDVQTAYEKLYRLPAGDEIARLVKDAHPGADLAALAFGASGAAGAIQAAMQTMQHPWVKVTQEANSARAFAEMQAIGRALSASPPYEELLGTSLRPSLGDWRDLGLPADGLLSDPLERLSLYRRQGVDPSLTDFPAAAFEESVTAAGLSEPRPESEEPEDDGFSLAREAFQQLQHFEQAIRRFIERVMLSAYGDRWMKQRLPANMFDSWIAKRDAAVKAGEAELPLIDYADFSDYRQIIERGDNWREVFKPIFGRPEDIRESFQRLHPVRIATMHARIITTDDRLLLLVETKRVLRAVRNAP